MYLCQIDGLILRKKGDKNGTHHFDLFGNLIYITSGVYIFIHYQQGQ